MRWFFPENSSYILNNVKKSTAVKYCKKINQQPNMVWSFPHCFKPRFHFTNSPPLVERFSSHPWLLRRHICLLSRAWCGPKGRDSQSFLGARRAEMKCRPKMCTRSDFLGQKCQIFTDGFMMVQWVFMGVTLWLCQNSLWQLPFLVRFPMKNGDFPSLC